jgi:hypothetical protein
MLAERGNGASIAGPSVVHRAWSVFRPLSGRVEAMSLYAGAGCGEMHDVPRAGELVDCLWHDCQASMRR